MQRSSALVKACSREQGTYGSGRGMEDEEARCLNAEREAQTSGEGPCSEARSWMHLGLHGYVNGVGEVR